MWYAEISWVLADRWRGLQGEIESGAVQAAESGTGMGRPRIAVWHTRAEASATDAESRLMKRFGDSAGLEGVEFMVRWPKGPPLGDLLLEALADGLEKGLSEDVCKEWSEAEWVRQWVLYEAACDGLVGQRPALAPGEGRQVRKLLESREAAEGGVPDGG